MQHFELPSSSSNDQEVLWIQLSTYLLKLESCQNCVSTVAQTEY